MAEVVVVVVVPKMTINLSSLLDSLTNGLLAELNREIERSFHVCGFSLQRPEIIIIVGPNLLQSDSVPARPGDDNSSHLDLSG